MSEPAISVRNLSKRYQLGTIGRHTLVEEVTHWWHKLCGRDPRAYMGKIGHTATEARRVEAEKQGNEEFWALREVSFDVQPGEVVGIIGRNGAGKSTLLKILSRITEPSGGDAFIEGRVGSLLEVGTGFHPELTGRENIYMNGTILGMKRAEVNGKLDDIIDFAGLVEFIDTPVKRYSSGMYVRLAFSVAAHLEPEILLVDEVLAVGDAAFQNRCLGKMSEVARDGRTVLFVSHNMAAISSLCTRTVWIDGGRIEADGLAAEITTRYISASIQKGAESVLSQRKDRKGDGALRVVDVQWENSTGQTVSVLQSGEVYRMVLGYTCPDGKPRKNVFVSYMISDLMGTCLMLHQTSFTHQNLDLSSAEGRIVCTLPRLPLVAGEYVLTIYVGISKQACDVIENAARIVVEGGDYYGTGHLGRGNLCKLLCDCSWTCETQKSSAR